jgi:hypothetical protein
MKAAMRVVTRWALVGLVLLLAVGPASAQTCAASSSWVTNPSEPNFNVDPTSLCAFYQYSWQSFLYLTSPAPGNYGALNFELFPSVSDVFGQGAALEANENKAVGPFRVFLDKRTNRARFFQARGSEPLDDIEQAGSEGVLVDQNGNVTYYEQYLDPIAAGFFQSCGLTTTSCQSATWAQNLRFPAGAIELKISWRPLPAGTPNASSYYTLQNVEVFNPQTGQDQTVNLGLVGFHLVYTTPNHKEMVWATFEHVDNAPNGPCAGPTTPPAGFTGWAFNKASSTDCSNVNKWTSGTQPPYPITQAFRNWAFGSDSSSSGKNNAATIQNLNANVLNILPAGSVWRNYFLLGAIWTNGTLPAVFGSNEFGSTLLANSTMETFTQFPNPPSGTSDQNCFFCHNAEKTSTNPPNKPAFFVSHAVFNGSAGNCPYTSLPPACQNTQTLTVQLMSMHKKSGTK